MRSDNYLNLCLEQASLSPLRFRHGCVVVKGGKVIGQGFNDYRPGYDGGALKTGQLTKKSAPIHQKKSKSKFKPKPKPMADMKASRGPSDFIPFEKVGGNGGGNRANRAFTMHSEMMAINSALAFSSTVAASTMSYVKPLFKLPVHGHNPGGLLRNHAIQAYVQHVCLTGRGQEVQPRTSALQDPEWRFEPRAYQCNQEKQEQRKQRQQEEEQAI